MKTCILIFSLFLFGIVHSQKAYFLNLHSAYKSANAQNLAGADLLHCELSRGSLDVIDAYSFQDSVFRLPLDNPKINYLIRSESRENNTAFLGNSLPHNSFTFTVSNGTEYEVTAYHFNDGFVGGRGAHDYKYIDVSGIGRIFQGSNNYGNGPFSGFVMVSFKNPKIQNDLSEIFDSLHLSNDWLPWNKIAEISRKFEYNNLIGLLTETWMRSRDDIVSTRIEIQYPEVRGGMVTLAAFIKNTSDKGYFIPRGRLIGPSRATIQFRDRKEPWELTNPYSGKHFKLIRDSIFLAPGEEIKLSHSFPEHIGCGSCQRVTYSGFQIQSPIELYDWLLETDKLLRNNMAYRAFPYREVYMLN